MTMQRKITGSKITYRPMLESDLSSSERGQAYERSTRMGRIARLTAAKLHAASIKITERKLGMAKWYCLRVEASKESSVEKALVEAGVEVFSPSEYFTIVRKGQKVEGSRALFAGYILVRCVPSGDAFQGLRQVKNVVDIVGGAAGYHVVRDADIEALKALGTNADVPRTVTDKTMKDGDTAEITFGPFSGFSCIVVAVKWCRQAKARVLIDVMGRPFEISSMPLAFLKKA